MIGPSDYSANFYSSPAARQAAQAAALPPQSAADEAKAVADFTRILNAPASASAVSAPAQSAAPADTESHSFLHFLKNVFDVINPLQHIPVVGAIYRHFTGDEISPMAHIAGDILYGGPIGGAIAVADIAYQNSTGKNMGETVIAALTGSNNDPTPAQASPGATTIARNDISWTTNVPLSRTPTPAPSIGTMETEPASTPTPMPVLTAKDGVPAFQSQTALKVDSTTALRMQEAPAEDARTVVPPELIAARMADALGKYQAMYRQPDAYSMSGVY